MTMPWSNQATNLVVVQAGTGFTGIFVYNGAPAAGNLIASTAADPGTDNHGNAYLGGFTVYTTAAPFEAMQTLAGEINFYTAASQAGPWTNTNMHIGFTFLGGVAQELTLVAPFLSLNNGTGIAVDSPWNAIQPGTNVAETWHSPSMAAGFADAGTTSAVGFQLEPVGTGGRVRLRGRVNLTANQASGATMFTLPAGYQPVQNQNFVTVNNLSGFSGAAPNSVTLNGGSGAVMLGSAGSTGNNVRLDGIVIELD